MTDVVNKLAQGPLPCIAIVTQGHSLLLLVRGSQGSVIVHRSGDLFSTDDTSGLGHGLSTVFVLRRLPAWVPSDQVVSPLGYLRHLSLLSVLHTQAQRQRQLQARDSGKERTKLVRQAWWCTREVQSSDPRNPHKR